MKDCISNMPLHVAMIETVTNPIVATPIAKRVKIPNTSIVPTTISRIAKTAMISVPRYSTGDEISPERMKLPETIRSAPRAHLIRSIATAFPSARRALIAKMKLRTFFADLFLRMPTILFLLENLLSSSGWRSPRVVRPGSTDSVSETFIAYVVFDQVKNKSISDPKEEILKNT